MKKTFAEIGFGNETFFSTEIEENDREYRIPRFIMPSNFYDLYFRFWIGKRSCVFSTKDGIKIKGKDRNKFELLFGIGGRDMTDETNH